jgi:hypothetical protein
MRFPRGLVYLLAAAVVVPIALRSSSAASAGWPAQGTGSTAGAGTVLPTGTAPRATVTGTSVTLSWTAATMTDGGAVAGYIVSKYNAATGSPATVGAGCSGVVTAPACTEQSTAAGTWVYTVTPVQMTWTGGQSPDSATVTVA